MSNIYIQEPPTHGKVLLKTSVGDIDLELWSKEAPKACRNFVQLCMEGYYDGTIFHRVVKGFIAQGGDPSGTGTGGESIYGKPFKDEIHSRLQFNRRGLVAMANAGRDDNGSQFFFTLAATSELQGKHTIFAKVTGETVFNMIKLEDTLVDQEDRPMYPQKVLKSEVLNNPFLDIIPRGEPKETPGKEDKKKKDKKAGVKNYKLLSFGSEAEEDDEETVEANRRYVGKSKSQHDLALDPKLSSEPAVNMSTNLSTSGGESSDSEHAREQVERIRNRLKKIQKTSELDEPIVENDDDVEEEYEFGKERREEKERKVEELRKEIRDLKRGMQSSKAKTDQKQDNIKDTPKHTDTTVVQYKEEIEKYRTLKQEMPKKGGTREEITLALLAKFQKKLRAAKEKQTQESEIPITKSDDEESDDWLSHKLEFEEKMPILAKDASTKSDEWFEMTDPRNPINKRRREASKAHLESKEKRTRH